MKKGQIIKLESNDYSVLTDNETLICKCRGRFRKEGLTPLVGDRVKYDEEKRVIEEVLPRDNEFKRPKVANVNQAFIITSLKLPDFSLNLLDKLLVLMELKKVDPIICITKKDLLTEEEFQKINTYLQYYESIGYKILYNTDIEEIKKVLKGKISVFVGQTGAGKSTLLNKLEPDFALKTGEVSKALGRGRHTTRVVEVFSLCGGQVFDTPGFSSLEFASFKEEDIRDAFREFKKFPCEYKDCMHINEKECLVKEAVNAGKILKERYDNYLSLIKKR